jgi:uncharacterized protein (DUF433 family)
MFVVSGLIDRAVRSVFDPSTCLLVLQSGSGVSPLVSVPEPERRRDASVTLSSRVIGFQRSGRLRYYALLMRLAMDEQILRKRITVNPKIFGGKPIIRGRRLAVEHILGMLTAGDTAETILQRYPWLEKEDVQACPVYNYR